MSTATYYQSVIHATWVNNKRKPFDDPRVRRAMHLVLDRPVLIEVVKDVAPMMIGGFLYPFSEFATPQEEREKRLGYEADPSAAIKEARALMAAAGHGDGLKGLDYLVRDVAIFKLWSQAIQAMLKETLNIECNLRTVVESVWFDDAASGNFDWRSAPSCRRCSIPPTTSMPGTARTARRTTRSGTTRSSRP